MFLRGKKQEKWVNFASKLIFENVTIAFHIRVQILYDISYLFRFFKNKMPKINKNSEIKIIDKKLIVWIFSINLDFHKDIF
ncbi:hypothetical protein DR083_02140 [Mycoplasma hyopneumoniae]|nr:hypothetical protein [Mesomycoplasma hyopneumoniae]